MSKGKKNLRLPITNPDITNTDPAYWEMVLESYGLGMGRGRTPQQIYVGASEDMDRFQEWLDSKSTGKVDPPGHGPNYD